MFKELQYYYNKNNTFHFIFLTISIFIFIRNTNIISYENIIPLIVTMMIMYILLNIYNIKSENRNLKMAIIYKNFNYDDYPDIKRDEDIILILSKIKGLYDINPVEFRLLLKSINEFLYEFERTKYNSIYKDTIYTKLRDLASNIMNILNSFSVNINYRNSEINDLEIDTKIIKTSVENYPYSINEMQIWLSRKLTKIEININDKWLNGKININSHPVYPDDINGIEYKPDNYNIY